MKALVPQVDAVIVVGSPNSSNSNRLREVASHRGVPAWMVDRADELQPEWVAGRRRVGVTAGASAPEVLVRQVIERLKALGALGVTELPGTTESVMFPMPKGLAGDGHAKAPEIGSAPRSPTAARRNHASTATNDASDSSAAAIAATTPCRPPSVSARTSASAK